MMDRFHILNRWLIVLVLGLGATVLPSVGQNSSKGSKTSNSDSAYSAGIHAMNEGRWMDAITSFGTAAAEPHGIHADASLYWEAYSYSRMVLRRQSIQTCDLLRSNYPTSTWNHDCDALLLEMKQHPGSVGKELPPIPPSTDSVSPDDDLRLLALNSLLHKTPAEGVTAARGMLLAGEPAVKQQILFALTQSSSQEAESLLKEAMVGKFGAVTQEQSIRAVIEYSTIRAPELVVGVYRTTSSVGTKSAVIDALAMWQDWADLVTLARAEHDVTLKRQMVAVLAKSDAPVALEFLKELLR
jgi:hypothetical protein